MSRRVPIPLAELFDRLVILQIKEILDSQNIEAYIREIDEVMAAIDAIILPLKRPLDAYLIRLIVSLAQINLHIWHVKDVMRRDPRQFDAMMKLGHQLNGIRNQVKNLMAEEFGVTAPAQKKTNVWTEDLHGWAMGVARGRRAIEAEYPDASHGPHTSYEFLLTDLIDALTIAQIKETLFPDEKKSAYTAELADVSGDMQGILAQSPHLLSAGIARRIAFLAQANLHVWHLKDEMQTAPDRYNDLLRLAQDINGLRNHVRNLLMEEFGESNPAKRKTTFLDFAGERWYSELLVSLGNP